jgi:undecaprenyl-diphosphatase
MPDRNPPSPPPGERGPLGPSPSAPPKPEEIKRGGPLLLVGFGALVACALVLAFLAGAVRRQETYQLDTVGNTFMHGFASPAMDLVMKGASSVGLDLGLFVIASGAALLLLRHRRNREALFIGVVLLGSILLNSGMKLFFHRARPVLPWAVVPPDYSFPSGHSMNSLALGLAITVVVWRLAGPRWGAVSLVASLAIAGLIGLSRIYLGYHYPTDVLGGFATAALWVGIVIGVFRIAARSRRPAGSRAAGSPSR